MVPFGGERSSNGLPGCDTPDQLAFLVVAIQRDAVRCDTWNSAMIILQGVEGLCLTISTTPEGWLCPPTGHVGH